MLIAVMETWLKKIFWIFALIVYLPALITSTSPYSCLNPTQSIEISCSDDGVIFDVNITSAVGKCGQSSCTGYTPELIKQKLNCYWKNKCTIDHPKDVIIQITSGSDKCIGKKPNVLVFYSWKCTQKGVNVIDLKTNTTFNIGDRGILRSHSRFPWVYSAKDFNKEFKETYIVTVTFWLTTGYTVILTVDKVNVTEPDTLTWHTKQNTTYVPVSMGTVHFNQSAEKVYLQLSLSKDSNGDSGFLICFDYSSNGGTIQNACSNLTTTHYKAKLLKSTRGKKNRKGKKDEKHKTKKGKGSRNKKEKTTRKPQRQSSG